MRAYEINATPISLLILGSSSLLWKVTAHLAEAQRLLAGRHVLFPSRPRFGRVF